MTSPGHRASSRALPTFRSVAYSHNAIRIRGSSRWPVFEALEQGTLKLQGRQAGTCQHIFDRFDHLWTFLDYEGAEPTNNASERSLRSDVATALSLFPPSSVGGFGCFWRKLSFGTQRTAGSRFVETMLSVIETCRQQDNNVFAFVTNAAESLFTGHSPPLLLPGL